MALEAKRATYNTAVVAAMAAWDDLMDGLSPGDVLLVVPIDEKLGAASTAALPSASPAFQTKTRIHVKRATNDGSNKYAIAGAPSGGIRLATPMFWLATNAAGELS